MSNEAEGQKDADQAKFEAPAEPVKSLDDDPAKTWDFFQFKKIMNEIPTGTATVGSILGAMVYQISQSSSSPQEDSAPPEQERAQLSKKMSSRALKRKSTLELMQATADEEEMGAVFDEVVHQLALEHSLVETDYKHQFDERLV